MTSIRSLLYVAWLYVTMFLVTTLGSPLLLLSRRTAMAVPHAWAWLARFGLWLICGVTVEVRGLEHRPKAGTSALIAAKHMCMYDTIAPFLFVDEVAIKQKKELLPLPFFGWFVKKSDMIPIDRSAGSKAIKDMISISRRLTSEGRQLLIFPEGTRNPVEEMTPDYKPGVAALYKDLGLPCHLMATNSGVCWPPHGFKRYPGKIIFEFLPPIEAGLKRDDFMREVETRLETASKALYSQAGRKGFKSPFES